MRAAGAAVRGGGAGGLEGRTRSSEEGTFAEKRGGVLRVRFLRRACALAALGEGTPAGRSAFSAPRLVPALARVEGREGQRTGRMFGTNELSCSGNREGSDQGHPDVTKPVTKVCQIRSSQRLTPPLTYC
jgi:hypothetical protein